MPSEYENITSTINKWANGPFSPNIQQQQQHKAKHTNIQYQSLLYRILIVSAAGPVCDVLLFSVKRKEAKRSQNG